MFLLEFGAKCEQIMISCTGRPTVKSVTANWDL